MRRFTRLTKALSTKLENHIHMISLFTVPYNFRRIRQTLRFTPAKESGLNKTTRDMEWIVDLMNARTPAPKRPEKYRKRNSK